MNPEPALGIVTIGQTPRPDLEAVFREGLPGVSVRVVGALDGLDDEAIAALARRETTYPLLVRLASGGSAEIGLQILHPLVERQAQRMAAEGAFAVVVACAGAFPDCTCAVSVIRPGVVVPAAVAALSPRRRVGVVTPIEGQAKAAEAKWRADGFEPVMTWASPVRHEEIETAAARMREADVDLVVLDCMGHDAHYADAFATRCGHRVVTAQALTIYEIRKMGTVPNS